MGERRPISRRSGVPLFIVRGIPVEAHWSLAIAALLIARAWVLVLFPIRYPDLGGRAYALMAVGATILFFASILLHELGHIFQSIREGVAASHITLWFFGGVAWGGDPRSPAAEARIIAAGPAVSAVLALSFGALAWVGDRAGWSEALTGVPLLLAQVNLLLVALNLLPIYPLDGGRLLHAWLWHRREDSRSAALSVAWIGQLVGAATIAFGGLAPFFGVVPAAFSAASVVDGLSIMLFGALGLYLGIYAEDAAVRQ